MSFETSLRFTQSSDEFFFTASNQIVKDLCETSPDIRKYRKRPQASKLVPGNFAHGYLTTYEASRKISC